MGTGSHGDHSHPTGVSIRLTQSTGAGPDRGDSPAVDFLAFAVPESLVGRTRWSSSGWWGWGYPGRHRLHSSHTAYLACRAERRGRVTKAWRLAALLWHQPFRTLFSGAGLLYLRLDISFKSSAPRHPNVHGFWGAGWAAAAAGGRHVVPTSFLGFIPGLHSLDTGTSLRWKRTAGDLGAQSC